MTIEEVRRIVGRQSGNSPKNMVMRILIGAAIFMALTVPALAEPPSTPAGSFSKAKQLARDVVYKGHQTTFYCGCPWAPKNNASGGTIDVENCGYAIKSNATRGNRVEWEHILPAFFIGVGRQCRDDRDAFPKCKKANGSLLSKRKCCNKVDYQYKTAHNDLHNLVPSVGEINADRSNHPYGVVPGETRVYGTCNFEMGTNPKRAEPAMSVRGNIARVWLYMSETYNIKISDDQKVMFIYWSLLDPVDEWEIERDKRIEKLQGNRNPFVRPKF